GAERSGPIAAMEMSNDARIKTSERIRSFLDLSARSVRRAEHDPETLIHGSNCARHDRTAQGRRARSKEGATDRSSAHGSRPAHPREDD
ncbi:MAG TPA: hypothetical protein VK116_12370, partial [Planctomycetota bacterium]|nr:hypothetical protein [Planctomycetota bacterium]